MARELVLQSNRTNVVAVSLGIDVSEDVLVSEIRAQANPTSELLATWEINYVTDGTDGELLLSLDNSVVGSITQRTAYMDIKRIIGGEPFSVFDSPLFVVFRKTVTA